MEYEELFHRSCKRCPCKRLEIVVGIMQCVECGHLDTEHNTTQELLPDILSKLVLLGKSNEMILRYLRQFGLSFSLSTLKRRLKQFGITRTVPLEPETVLNLVQNAQEKCQETAGYRRVTRIIRDKFNVAIKRDDVMAAARVLDPEAGERRKGKKFVRRIFQSPGPNDCWSIDGHDKLATYGIYIHGAIDCFSRRVLWCTTYTTNKNPNFVVKLFADTIQKLEVVPNRARFDPGTENTLSIELQMFLRRNGTDVASERPAVVDKSKLNQKIECFWSGMYRHVTYGLHQQFTQMLRDGLPVDVQENRDAFIYVYLPLVKRQVDDYIRDWNLHKIRQQKGVSLPCGGCPDDMYNHPDLFGGEQCGYHYGVEAADDMEFAAEYHEIADHFEDIVPAQFRAEADEFLNQNNMVLCMQNAQAIFLALCDR